MKQEVSVDRPEQPGILVEYMQLDLASLQSVKRFTTTLTERNQPLHILINNAGISWVHYGACIILYIYIQPECAMVRVYTQAE